MSAFDSIADELFDLVRIALADLTYNQRRCYELVHGITGDGTTEKLPYREAAEQLGIAPATAWVHLQAAEAAVWRAIAMHYVDAERIRRADDDIASLMCDDHRAPLTSNSRNGLEQHGIDAAPRAAGTGGTILGERSERIIREDKRSTNRGRRYHSELAQREAVAR